MSLGRLVLRSLAYYWRTGVVVVFGLAVATAVITGSLVIGDSVTGNVPGVPSVLGISSVAVAIGA